MSTPIRLADARLDHEDAKSTLSGQLDGERIFWAMPARESIALRGEPFVAAALVSAMRSGRDLVLPDNAPVDAMFLQNITELQTIFSRWFPGLVPVTIHTGNVAPRIGTAGRLTGYSGGVDSSYTVMSLTNQLDGVALFDGIEYGDANPVLMSRVDDALRQAMTARHLPMVTVQTNAKAIGKRLGGRWSQFIGGTLASLPHALGAASYHIAGSNSWENARPYGTHPFTDPLWSSAQVQVLHHGADARRMDKLRALGSAPDLLAVIRVCFQGSDYNCGVCQKCGQTSAAMRALGLTSAAMPALTDAGLLRTLMVEHDGDLVDWAEILTPDLQQRDPDLHRELFRLVQRYRVRRLTRSADDVLFGGRLRQWLGRRDSK